MGWGSSSTLGFAKASLAVALPDQKGSSLIPFPFDFYRCGAGGD